MAPQWILDFCHSSIGSDGCVALDSATLDLLTRGIMQTPEPKLEPAPPNESFEWVVQPDPNAVHVEAYVDGSRLHGGHDLYVLCARQGWAIAAYDSERRLVAAAHGRIPFWALGIHATELWGLLMAVQSLDPGCTLKVDCASVQLGAQRD